MQIVELTNAGEACLEHFHEGKCADRLDFLGSEPVEKTIHELAPRPEAVLDWPRDFSKARHCALKRVAMYVGDARDPNLMPIVRRLRRGLHINPADAAGFNCDPHVLGPALSEERFAEPETSHGLHACA